MHLFPFIVSCISQYKLPIIHIYSLFIFLFQLETLQQESAAKLQNVPGLNPMEIPAEMMLKPPLTPWNSIYS